MSYQGTLEDVKLGRTSSKKDDLRTATTSNVKSTKIRRGAKFIVADYAFNPETLATPEQLEEETHTDFHHRHSSDWKRPELAWRRWCTRALDALRYRLYQNLPHPADAETYGALYFDLGQAADRGEMPSFADAGARSGYAVEFLCRARLLADLWYQKYHGHNHNNRRGTNDQDIKLLSLGGGPGFDFIGVLLAQTFLAGGETRNRIEGMVFDYEPGWADLVEAIDIATQATFINVNRSHVAWGGTCDITQPLTHPSNAQCSAALPTSNLVVCQYCICENANQLRASGFCFFADLFDVASLDTIIILSEVTPRLWPEIIQLLVQRQQNQHPNEGDVGFDVDFVHGKKRHYSPQLILHKRLGGKIGQRDLDVCRDFSILLDLHQRKMENGFQRQFKKVKGAK